MRPVLDLLDPLRRDHDEIAEDAFEGDGAVGVREDSGKAALAADDELGACQQRGRDLPGREDALREPILRAANSDAGEQREQRQQEDDPGWAAATGTGPRSAIERQWKNFLRLRM